MYKGTSDVKGSAVSCIICNSMVCIPLNYNRISYPILSYPFCLHLQEPEVGLSFLLSHLIHVAFPPGLFQDRSYMLLRNNGSLNGLHSVVPQTIELFVTSGVRTSNPTQH
jgi:hypothetical protein